MENAHKVKGDISAYVCRAMVYGALSGHGISRAMISEACERYAKAHPRRDLTAMPMALFYDDGTDVNRAVVEMAKEHCADAVVSADGKSVLLVGDAAKEIVSKLDLSGGTVQRLKTKMKVRCGFPVNRSLKCFGGRRVCDCIGKENCDVEGD